MSPLSRARAAVPNAAHTALALMACASFRHRIAPDSSFTLVTQNVDGLSTRALDQVLSNFSDDDRPNADEVSDILEMHGRLFDVVCTSQSCGHQEFNHDSPICPALAGMENLIDVGVVEPIIPIKDLPRCSRCGELSRPGVVWFGEIPHHMDHIDELIDNADLCLVIGTSSTVCF